MKSGRGYLSTDKIAFSVQARRRLLQEEHKKFKTYWRDASRLNRIINPFHLLVHEESQKLKEQGVKVHCAGLVEDASGKWKEMSAEEKEIYRQRARERQKRAATKIGNDRKQKLRYMTYINSVTVHRAKLLQWRRLLVKHKAPANKTPKADTANCT